MIRVLDDECLTYKYLYEGDFICSQCKEPLGCMDDLETDKDFDCVLDDGRFFHTGCHIEYLNSI